jgi:hypothetical protein
VRKKATLFFGSPATQRKLSDLVGISEKINVDAKKILRSPWTTENPSGNLRD